MRLRIAVGALALIAGCGSAPGSTAPALTVIEDATTTQTVVALPPTSASTGSTTLPKVDSALPAGFALMLTSGKTVRFLDLGTGQTAQAEVPARFRVSRQGSALIATAGGSAADNYVSEYWLLSSPGAAVKLPVHEGLSVGARGEIWGWVVGEPTRPGFRLVRAMDSEGNTIRSFNLPVSAAGPFPLDGGAVIGIEKLIYFLETATGAVRLIAEGQLHGIVGDRFDWTHCNESGACSRLLSTADGRDEVVTYTDHPPIPALRSFSPNMEKYVEWIPFTGTLEVRTLHVDSKALVSYHYGTGCGNTDWSPDSVWFLVFDCDHTIVAINTTTSALVRVDIATQGKIDPLGVATIALPQSWFDATPWQWTMATPQIVKRLPTEPCPSAAACSMPSAA